MDYSGVDIVTVLLTLISQKKYQRNIGNIFKMSEPELKFCRLCGKHKPTNEFVEVALARFENSVYIQSVCKLCSTVVHNIRTVVSEVMKQKQEQKEAKSKIIVPSVMVPRNIS